MSELKRTRTLLIVGVTVVVVLGLTAFAVANLPGSGRMSGVIAKQGSASVRAVDQLGAHGSILVAQVIAPDESWVVAYRNGMDGMPGALLGYAHVGAGTSTDVAVPIDPTIRLTPQAVITLNADRGVRGRFEFDMNHFDTSPDKPYYVAGRAVQTTITVAFPEMSNYIDPNEVTITAP